VITQAFISRSCRSLRLFTLASIVALANIDGPCRAAEGAPIAQLKLIATNFVSPVVLTPYPDASRRLVVVDQIGVASIVGADGQTTPFLDLRSRMAKLNNGFDERGFLGLAFHPRFQETKKVYALYNAPLREGGPAEWDNTIHVCEFKVDNAGRPDPNSERVVLTIDKPYFNHNGGCLAFGPDGLLYISVGDGGNGNDEGKRPETGNGQNLNTLLGKVLRIDVDHGQPYAIPSDNPFAHGPGKPEIFAYGLRNPWRMSFDRGGDHELFAGDIGQDLFEEVDIIRRGANYGWRIREGLHCFNPKDTHRPPEDCPKVGADGSPLVDPIFEYKNFKAFPKDPEARGVSVVGGFVYRGKALPRLEGRYVFADWSRNFVLPDGVVYVATRPGDGQGKWKIEPLPLDKHLDGRVGAFIVSMGQDAEGELYVLTNGSNSLIGKNGKIYKLAPAGNQ